MGDAGGAAGGGQGTAGAAGVVAGGRPGTAWGRPGAGRGRPGTAGGCREARRAPGDQYLENRRRRRTPKRRLAIISLPFLTEGLSKVEVSPKNYFSGRDPDTIVFLQPSVSRRREATFWNMGALLKNPFPSFLQNHRKGCQISTSGKTPADSPDSAETVTEACPGTSLPHAPGVRMT